jgi:NAD(P)-dependent dehydrogenase (short-subunit alcohol dehydrogenase family)
MKSRVQPSIGLLKGKVAIITGAARDLGQAMTSVFIREGASVAAVDANRAVHELASESRAAKAWYCDVTQEDQVTSMIAEVQRYFGRIDVLINNSSPIAYRESQITPPEYEQLTALNLRAVLLCSQHALRAMVPNGAGAIVNVTWVGGLNAEEHSSVVYSAAAAGVHALTRTLALDYGPRGIRINAIATGICTFGSLPVPLSDLSAKNPMGRAGEPEELAHAAAFLASDRASFVSGTVVPVDGGWSARLA